MLPPLLCCLLVSLSSSGRVPLPPPYLPPAPPPTSPPVYQPLPPPPLEYQEPPYQPELEPVYGDELPPPAENVPYYMEPMPMDPLPYDPGMTSNDNGYGQRPPHCFMEERTVFTDKCIPYTERVCYTQNTERCRPVLLNNCTGLVETSVDRVCFNVTELVCDLEEHIAYEPLEETYRVQRCTTVKDRVCDTVYDIELDTRDDFQCINVDSEHCYDEESIVNDVSCKYSFEFDCKKEKRQGGGYGKEMVCQKKPVKNCYDIPRSVRTEICAPRSRQICEKFTNPIPRPVERQNCHFEPKQICEIQIRSRPKKAKKFSYNQACRKIPRELCDQTERKKVVPHCDHTERLKCEFVPEQKCDEEEKKYCYKVERIVQEEVCDRKFSSETL